VGVPEYFNNVRGTPIPTFPHQRLCRNCHFEVKPRNLFFVCGWKHEIPRCARDDRCYAFAQYDTASLRWSCCR